MQAVLSTTVDMNSKKRRREEQRLLGSSQYALVPLSNIDVKLAVLERMGKDWQQIVKERKLLLEYIK